MEKYLTEKQVKTIIDGAPKGTDPDKLIEGLVSRGYTLQGLNDVKEEAAVEKPTVPVESDLLGKVKAFSGGVAESLGTDLPLAAIQKGGEMLVNKYGTEQMKQNVASAKPLTKQFEDITQQTENPKTAIAGNVVGFPASFVTGAAEVKALPIVASALEKGTVQKGVKAVGQIAQGKTDSLKPFQEALKAVGTKGVKTYKDLASKFDEALPAYSKVVDEALSKDTGIYKLSDLAIKAKSKGGSEVSTDYVTKALNGLKELYSTIGDDVAKTNIDETIAKATSNGLTRKEVNDISRIYNQEFGTKAFSKTTGDALTSINAQAFENTRKGLKEVARAGLGGEEAKAADRIMSSIYDAKGLVEKNVEAVNKLQQKIQERGWVSSAAYNAVKLADTLSGGLIRGATDAVLNRGSGLKTLNALDLEKNLSKNLKLIDEAMKSNTQKRFIETLEKLSK